LAELISDPRSDVNWLIHIFTVERALQQLAEDVAAGKPSLECKLDFATELHFCERYERALEVIGAILHERPGNDEALSLRADIWNHQKKHAEAEQLALELIARNPRNKRARLELVNAYEGLEKWDLMFAAATENSQMLTDEYDKLNAIFERSKALWRVGRLEESESDYRTLLADPRPRRSAMWSKNVLKYRERFPAG
jgi:tetratricopeptide (TPR) repeat protein